MPCGCWSIGPNFMVPGARRVEHGNADDFGLGGIARVETWGLTRPCDRDPRCVRSNP